MDSGRGDVVTLVVAAQAGDPDSMAALVERYQDVAVGIAFAQLGSQDAALDVAQDALITVLERLSELRDPQAFPAWLVSIVRWRCVRMMRSSARARKAYDRLGAFATDRSEDPAEAAERSDEVAALRRALERLPRAERTVLALTHFAELSHNEIAEFLGIPVATVKTRAFRARRNLRGHLTMVESTFAASRPSRSQAFSSVVRLYASIRAGDAGAVFRLLDLHPELVGAEERWDLEEGRAAGLVYPGRGTPLIRSAELGHVEVVRILLARGATIEGPCGCDAAESALWAAASNGRVDVVGVLLEAGADPNAVAAESGTTALHLAAIRGDHTLAEVLLAAGAEPGRRDAGGRTAAEWDAAKGNVELSAVLGRGEPARQIDIPPVKSTASPFFATGLASFDVLAPWPLGALVWWKGSYGLGQQVLMAELALRSPEVTVVWAGVESDLLDVVELEHLRAEANISSDRFHVHLLPEKTPRVERAERLAAAVAEMEELATDGPVLAVLVEPSEGRTDVDAVLPRLKRRDGVVATVVLTPRLETAEETDLLPPTGFDVQVVLDPARAQRHRYPAVDLLRTVSNAPVDPAAAADVERARRALLALHESDPTLGGIEAGAPTRTDLSAEARTGVALHRLLSDDLLVSEAFTATPATRRSRADLLVSLAELLGRES